MIVILERDCDGLYDGVFVEIELKVLIAVDCEIGHFFFESIGDVAEGLPDGIFDHLFFGFS